MTHAEADLVDADRIAEYRRDGVTIVRGVFSDWIDGLRRGVERNLADPGPYTKGYTAEGDSGRFFGDYCNWQRIPEYEDFVRHSPAGAIAATLMGSPYARFFHEHVLVKEPGTRERTPWHHDQPYYGIDATRTCSLWIPLGVMYEKGRGLPQDCAEAVRWYKTAAGHGNASA